MWNKFKKAVARRLRPSDEPPSDEHPSNHTQAEELPDQPEENDLSLEGFEDALEFESGLPEPVSPPHIPAPVFQPRTPPNKRGPHYVQGVRGIIPGNRQYEAQVGASIHWAIDTRRRRGFPELKNKYKFLYDATGKKTEAQMNAREQREWADLPGNESGVRFRKTMIRRVKAFDKEQLEDFREEDRINYRDGEQALTEAQERRRAENDAVWEQMKEWRQEAREAAAERSRRIRLAEKRKIEQDRREKEKKKPKAEQPKKGTNNEPAKRKREDKPDDGNGAGPSKKPKAEQPKEGTNSKPAKRKREDKPDDGNDAAPKKKQKASSSSNERKGSSIAADGTRKSRRIARLKPINYRE